MKFEGAIVEPPELAGTSVVIYFGNLDEPIHGGTWNASYRGESKDEIMRLRAMRRLRISQARNRTGHKK